MLSNKEIFETIDMIESQHFDVRTVTMGLSLFDCISDDYRKTCKNIYDKIAKKSRAAGRSSGALLA